MLQIFWCKQDRIVFRVSRNERIARVADVIKVLRPMIFLVTSFHCHIHHSAGKILVSKILPGKSNVSFGIISHACTFTVSLHLT